MVSSAKGTLFRRKDNKYLIYVPKALAEDSGFPFPLPEGEDSVKVKISFKIGVQKLTVEGDII